jgi:hypothetical protein
MISGDVHAKPSATLSWEVRSMPVESYKFKLLTLAVPYFSDAPTLRVGLTARFYVIASKRSVSVMKCRKK